MMATKITTVKILYAEFKKEGVEERSYIGFQRLGNEGPVTLIKGNASIGKMKECW